MSYDAANPATDLLLRLISTCPFAFHCHVLMEQFPQKYLESFKRKKWESPHLLNWIQKRLNRPEFQGTAIWIKNMLLHCSSLHHFISTYYCMCIYTQFKHPSLIESKYSTQEMDIIQQQLSIRSKLSFRNEPLILLTGVQLTKTTTTRVQSIETCRHNGLCRIMWEKQAKKQTIDLLSQRTEG